MYTASVTKAPLFEIDLLLLPADEFVGRRKEASPGPDDLSEACFPFFQRELPEGTGIGSQPCCELLKPPECVLGGWFHACLR